MNSKISPVMQGVRPQMMQPATKKFKGGSGSAEMPDFGAGTIGEVRYDDAVTAQSALALNGSTLMGAIITVEMDTHSKDGTRLKVTGVPKGADWQELKDHFAPFGRVAFANVKGGKLQVPVTGVVRYQTAEMADFALGAMNGLEIHGRQIEVKHHGGSKDATKLLVFGLPPSFGWQDLKDFAGQAGAVEFADIIKSDSDETGAGRVGEIRYDDPAHVPLAIQQLHGSLLGGACLTVLKDPASSDGSKVIVRDIPPGIEWQELKDHFGTIGRVAHSNIKSGPAGGLGGKGMMSLPKATAKFKGMGKNNMGMNPAMMQAMMAMMSGGMGKGFGGPTITARVQYESPMCAMMAKSMLNATGLNGGLIEVDFDWEANDGHTLRIQNIPAGTSKFQIEQHFKDIGPVQVALQSWS